MKTQFLLPLAAVSAIVTTVAPAQATSSYLVYVYINGTPTDVTAYATIGSGHVFLNSNWIGTLNASGQIINAENEIVGYLTEDPTDPGLTFSKWW